MNRVLSCVVAAAISVGCGKSGEPSGGPDKGKTNVLNPPDKKTPQAGSPTVLPLGTDGMDSWNYPYGKGEKAFDKANELYKAKKWADLAAVCDQTLAADPAHLDAHWMGALALAQDEKTWPKVGEHLSIALAGDWLRWGPGLEKVSELDAYLKGPHGDAVRQVNAAQKTALLDAIKKGPLVVAHRASYRPPAKTGVQYGSSRAELFVLVPDTNRYLRLTHTSFSLAGFLPLSGTQIAYVSWNKVKLPTDKDPPDAPVLLAEAHVGVMDLAAPDTEMKEASLKDARAIAVQDDVGDKVVATVFAPGNGRWELGAGKTFVIDAVNGEAKPAKDPQPGDRLLVTYEDVTITHVDVDGVEADFRPPADAASAFKLKGSQKVVTLPTGESAIRSSFVGSPSKNRLAFATAGDPCAPKPADQQSSLYVVDAATGKLKHVDSGISGFAARWLTEDTLLYEDDKGGLRIYDAVAGRDTGKKETRGGLSLVGTGATPAGTRICKTAPAAPATTSAAGDDAPEGALPPEVKNEEKTGGQ